jgi:hypothetical protein
MCVIIIPCHRVITLRLLHHVVIMLRLLRAITRLKVPSITLEDNQSEQQLSINTFNIHSSHKTY